MLWILKFLIINLLNFFNYNFFQKVLIYLIELFYIYSIVKYGGKICEKNKF